MTNQSFTSHPRFYYPKPAESGWLHSMPQNGLIAAIFALHILLGPVLAISPALSAAHTIATLLVGFYQAAFSPRVEKAIYVCAYITGAEVLWRMTKTPLFWELSKYSVIAILMVMILRFGMLRASAIPMLFFGLLLPSAVIPMTNVGTADLQNQISFNLSGPLSLAICVWFFSQIRLSSVDLQRIFLALICPLLSIAAIALYGTLTAARINFNNSSNYATSGGYGPTQVSSVLGFGALLIFLWLFQSRQPQMRKYLLVGVMVFFIAQSALTFSRGGLYAAIGSALAAAFFLVSDKRLRFRLFASVLLLGLTINFVIVPVLDEFTGGAMTKRFGNTSLTGRDSIMRGELQAFYDNPIFGVGPGEARNHRSDHRQAIAHTEFTRLLAEHGLFGLLAIVVLAAMSWRHFRKAQTKQEKALVVALTFWSFLFMASLAMRIVMAAFAFGLTAAVISQSEPDPDQPPALPATYS